ncbi:MAG: oligoendopeptidase [Gaiellaceae bacterium]|jgi:peptidyl-dipeptidase A|nr:oligoendopeptidase [Gaiellaceae bacterium]
MTGDAAAILAEAETRLAPRALAANLAWWNSQVEATEENAARRAKAELALSDTLADRDLFDAVTAARESGGNGLVRRQLDLLRNSMLTHQIPDTLRARIVELESSVDMRFSRHRGVVAGVEVGDTEIKRILRRSDDQAEREEAWEASKTVGAEVAADVRELARLRNEAARGLGYRDWFALSVSTDELDEVKLADTLAAADRVTAGPFARWKGALDETLAARFDCSLSELRPWHYADPFFQETPPDGAVDLDPLFADRDVVALARRTFEGVGLEVDGILERSDLYPREGKNQHAFCIDIDRAGDVRILANTVETHDCADTMLHELGHGVYNLGFLDDLPWFLRSTHLVTTEGSALFSGALSGRRDWLEVVLGASASDVAELGARLDAARAAELLVFTRWVLVMNAFERALYADPEADLDTIWWELVSRHQGITPPDGRRAPDWAAKIHIAVAPVYYHTYLYGAIVGLQLTAFLEGSAGGIVDRPDAGRILREKLFAPGQSVRWDRLVQNATGSPLSVASLERAVAKV